jgi:pimeloyl-ACP methyl ester carboxylesterase
MPIVKFKQGNIHYEVSGKGRAIVFLHGFLGSTKIWTDYIKKFENSYKIILIDLPGHGKSDCYGYIHTMELMAESVKSVLDELNLRRYILVGHSMGGYVSLAFAEMYPDNLKGLVLFHSTALADTDIKKLERTRSINLVKRNKSGYVRGAILNLFNPNLLQYFEPEIELSENIAKGISIRAIIDCLEGMKQRLNREVILKFAEYPILFLAGKNDRVIPFETIEQQAKLPRRSYTGFLKQAAHMSMFEEPTNSQKFLSRFFAVVYR